VKFAKTKRKMADAARNLEHVIERDIQVIRSLSPDK
jgi:hypothetical protein